jgi:spermidine synthase
MDLATVDLIVNTFCAVFPYSEMWLLRFNVDTPAIGLIGWAERPAIPANCVEEKASTALRQHLHTVALGDTLRLFGCRLGELRGTNSLALNTDEKPIVLFKAPYVTFRERDDPAARLLELLDRFAQSSSTPPIALGNEQFIPRLAAYIRARDVYLRGLIREEKGDIAAAVDFYVKSAKLSPEFTSGYAQALGIATSYARRNPQMARSILERLIEAQPDRPVARQLLEKLSSP